jgi:hypothetical protein
MADKKIEISEGDLQTLLKQNEALMAENRALAERGGSGEEKIDKMDTRGILKRLSTEKKTCVILFVDGLPVVGYKNKGTVLKPTYTYYRKDPNDPKNELMYVDLILYGKEEEAQGLAISYKEFLEGSEKVRCRILQTEKKEWTITQGVTSKKEVDGYRMVVLDVDVPVEIKGEIRWVTVEVPEAYPLPDGAKTLRIHENYVNITQAAELHEVEFGETELVK